MTREARIYDGLKTISLTSGAGKTGQPLVKVQVRCTILDAWGWCTGTTQRDGMGREEGGGFRMGNTCTPVVDSF